MIKHILPVLLIFLALPLNNFAKNNPIQEMLAIAKMSGACGIFGQMARFQSSTKIAGGDKFIKRFLLAESARLGVTTSQYLAQCQKANEMYEDYWNLSDKKQ